MTDQTNRTKPRVLVTGAGGVVFSSIEPMLRHRFAFRQTDGFVNDQTRPGVETLDLMDFDRLADAMRAADAVLHMAIASRRAFRDRPVERFLDEEVKVNCLGTQHVFEAARQAGVPRVVFMSSTTTMLGRPGPDTLRIDDPPRPNSPYACSKLYGEAMGEWYSREYGMTVICPRLGQPLPLPKYPGFDHPAMQRCRMVWVSLADVARAVRAALTADAVPFHVFYAVSRSPGDPVDLSAGRAIGYEPAHFATPAGFVDVRDAAATPSEES